LKGLKLGKSLVFGFRGFVNLGSDLPGFAVCRHPSTIFQLNFQKTKIDDKISFFNILINAHFHLTNHFTDAFMSKICFYNDTIPFKLKVPAQLHKSKMQCVFIHSVTKDDTMEVFVFSNS
jgi:hypothetical protein